VAVVVLAVAWYLFRPELLFVNARVHEELPSSAAHGQASEASILARGDFHGVAHQTRGTAIIHQLADGRRVLRFTDFSTSNGPALRVYLVAAADAGDNATVMRADFVDLGVLKGNQGEQNYEVPAGVDLSVYQAVTVWCSRFGVNFATAPLSPLG